MSIVVRLLVGPPFEIPEDKIADILAKFDVSEENQVISDCFAWFYHACFRSTFNVYHDQDNVLQQLNLALSVDDKKIDFSLAAHRLPPLPISAGGAERQMQVQYLRDMIAKPEAVAALMAAIPEE